LNTNRWWVLGFVAYSVRARFVTIDTVEKGRLRKKSRFINQIINELFILFLTIRIEPPISEPIPIIEPADDTMQPSPPELPPTILF